jgi:hypothetical protein
VDHFHLIMLANKAVTAVRQRVTRDLLGRRGRKLDPAWANRRRLLHGRERLSEAALARMWNGCLEHDPSGHPVAADRKGGTARAVCHRRPRRASRRDPGTAIHVLPLMRRRSAPRADHPGRDDRDLMAGDRGVPVDRAHERPNRGQERVDQAGETCRLWVPEPGELPASSAVALQPAFRPVVRDPHLGRLSTMDRTGQISKIGWSGVDWAEAAWGLLRGAQISARMLVRRFSVRSGCSTCAQSRSMTAA